MSEDVRADERPDDLEGPLLIAAGTDGNQRFGALVRSLRERSRLTPQELADKADVHVSFVRGIERGAQAPSLATAQTLLASMEEQDRIRWTREGSYDLVVCDPESGRSVAFAFKAGVKGQNRRPEIDLTGIAKVMLKALEGMPTFASSSSRPEEALEARARRLSQGDDSALGRVVRLLASADVQLLARIERQLLDERRGT